MKILDRYIGIRYLKFMGFSLIGFICLYILGDLLGHLDDIITNHVPVKIVFLYYLVMVPIVLVNIAPLSSLLSSLYTVGIMNYNNEIIAIRSSGRSVFSILRPIVFGAIFLSAIVFFVNERFVPGSMVFTTSLKKEFIKRNTSSKKEIVLKFLTFYSTDNRLFFISKFYPRQNLIKGILILEQDDRQQIRRKLVAQQAEWRDGWWYFDNLLIYKFDEHGNVIESEKEFYKRKKLRLKESPADMMRKESFIDSLPIKDLIRSLKRLAQSGDEETKLVFKVQILYRIIISLSPFILIFSGLPFVLRIQRRPPGFSVVGIGVVIFFIYYLLLAFLSSIAKLGVGNVYLIILPLPILFLLWGIISCIVIP